MDTDSSLKNKVFGPLSFYRDTFILYRKQLDSNILKYYVNKNYSFEIGAYAIINGSKRAEVYFKKQSAAIAYIDNYLIYNGAILIDSEETFNKYKLLI